MNQLDLTRLNYRSPYQVWEGERGYCFKTDHGIFYTVEFDPEESGLDIVAYWFNLTNNSHKYNKNGQFYIRTAEVKNGKITDYVALIIQRTHPAFNDIVELFDTEITMFQRNKDEEPEDSEEMPRETTTKRKPKK